MDPIAVGVRVKRCAALERLKESTTDQRPVAAVPIGVIVAIPVRPRFGIKIKELNA